MSKYFLQHNYDDKVWSMSNLLIQPDGIYKLDLKESADLWQLLTGRKSLCRYCKHEFIYHNVQYIVQHFYSKGTLYKVFDTPTFYQMVCFNQQCSKEGHVCFVEPHGIGETLESLKIRLKLK